MNTQEVGTVSAWIEKAPEGGVGYTFFVELAAKDGSFGVREQTFVPTTDPDVARVAELALRNIFVSLASSGLVAVVNKDAVTA